MFENCNWLMRFPPLNIVSYRIVSCRIVNLICDSEADLLQTNDLL